VRQLPVLGIPPAGNFNIQGIHEILMRRCNLTRLKLGIHCRSKQSSRWSRSAYRYSPREGLSQSNKRDQCAVYAQIQAES
jgi:hypothetical protein